MKIKSGKDSLFQSKRLNFCNSLKLKVIKKVPGGTANAHNFVLCEARSNSRIKWWVSDIQTNENRSCSIQSLWPNFKKPNLLIGSLQWNLYIDILLFQNVGCFTNKVWMSYKIWPKQTLPVSLLTYKTVFHIWKIHSWWACAQSHTLCCAVLCKQSNNSHCFDIISEFAHTLCIS